jgi:hypothetical protein
MTDHAWLHVTSITATKKTLCSRNWARGVVPTPRERKELAAATGVPHHRSRGARHAHYQQTGPQIQQNPRRNVDRKFRPERHQIRDLTRMDPAPRWADPASQPAAERGGATRHRVGPRSREPRWRRGRGDDAAEGATPRAPAAAATDEGQRLEPGRASGSRLRRRRRRAWRRGKRRTPESPIPGDAGASATGCQNRVPIHLTGLRGMEEMARPTRDCLPGEDVSGGEGAAVGDDRGCWESRGAAREREGVWVGLFISRGVPSCGFGLRAAMGLVRSVRAEKGIGGGGFFLYGIVFRSHLLLPR